MKKWMIGFMTTFTLITTGFAQTAPPVVAATTQSAPYFVTLGEKFYGTPYLIGAPRYFTWNGKINPSFTGQSFDCSSFTQYVAWMGLGVKLSGTSYDQGQKDGYFIPKSSLRSGDLVFFTTKDKASLPKGDPNRVGHVSLFAGYGDVMNGRFVPGGSYRPVMLEASTSAGVKCVYMDTAYWTNYYIASKRIVSW
ncbi:MAG TPA: NlpC/P60 family protein [Bacillota bacterium]|nr:NlpC/P60 family protein [Bacillota bacterium]